MKKQKVQNKPNARTTSSDTRMSPAAVRDTNILNPGPGSGAESPSAESPALVRWLVLVGIIGIAVGLLFLGSRIWQDGSSGPGKRSKPAKRWKPEVWQPRTEEEAIVDRFVRLRNEKNKSAFELLGPAPVFDKQPVSEEEAESRQTDYFLRGNLKFVDIWRGEPDGAGGQRSAAGRYTLVTKGNVSSPRLRIRGERAESQALGNNPDLIIEVRNGKIIGLRHELHMGP